MHKAKRVGERAGFTLTEVLVAVTVIGVLIALVLPAIQATRESARRVRCVNNLKQLGVAIHGYAASNGVFPRGEANGYSPHAMMLSELDQAALYNSINFSRHSALFLWENVTARSVGVAVFLCPSDTPIREAMTSYAGNAGVGFAPYDVKRNGPMAWGAGLVPFGYSSITDGTSQTAAMSEWCLGRLPGDRDPRRAVFETPALLDRERQFDQFASLCHGLDANNAKQSGPIKGAEWLAMAYGGSHYNHVLPPNDHSCKNRTLLPWGAWTAGSLHPGGANVLCCDGHVGFARASVAWGIWRAVGTMNGSEVVPDGTL